MESFFSTLKAERTARKVYRTRNEARADVFDYIERFYNPWRRHSKLGYLSPMEFEARAMLSTEPAAAQSGLAVVHGVLWSPAGRSLPGVKTLWLYREGLRTALSKRKIVPVIPPKANRRFSASFDKGTYKWGYLESYFRKLKETEASKFACAKQTQPSKRSFN